MDCLDLLATLPSFSALPQTQRERLARACRQIRIDKQRFLLHGGSAPTHYYHLLAGHLKRTGNSGQQTTEAVIELLFPGQALGFVELFAAQAHLADVIAVEPSLVLAMDGRVLLEIMQQNGPFMMRMMAELAQRQLEMENDLISSRSLMGSQRILDYLIQQAGGLNQTQTETRLLLPTSKQLIAARLGLTPETLSRGLRELTEQSLLIVDGKLILLQNTAILDRYGHELWISPAVPAGKRSWQMLAQAAITTPATPTLQPAAENSTLLPSLLPPLLPSTVNKAGRLRMLSQRMAKSWLMIGRGVLPGRARSMLKQSILQFERQLNELTALPVNKEVRQAQSALLLLWQNYKPLLANPATPTHVRKLFKLNEKLLAAAHSLTQAFANALDTPAGQIINLAGRERMLSQRMAKLYMLMEWKLTDTDATRCQTALSDAIDEFEAGLALLAEEVRDLPQIRNQVERAHRHWKLMRTTLESSSSPGQQSASICSFSEQLMKKMDTAIALYEQKLTA